MVKVKKKSDRVVEVNAPRRGGTRDHVRWFKLLLNLSLKRLNEIFLTNIE
jgi:hypothetical protein